MSRRHFMKIGAGSIALTTVPAALIGCAGVQRDDIPAFDSSRANLEGLNDDLKQILFHASLAPSGHNTQPWRVKITDPYHWVIQSDKERWLPAVDPTQRETLLSIGAFLENLTQAAGGFGYGVEYDVTAGSADDTEVAHVRLARQNTQTDARQNMISRRTVRKGYLGRELESADIRAITDGDADHFHYYPFSSSQGKLLNELTVAANRVQAARDDAQNELADWIRWSDGDALRNRDGLTPEGMEISGIAGWIVRHFYGKKDVLSADFREKTVDGVIDQTSRHAGWLVITSADQAVGTLLETGRRFERMFLKIRERRIAVHPMTQILEEAPYQDEIAQQLQADSTLQFLLRIGYLDSYPDPVTLRRPVEWFVHT